MGFFGSYIGYYFIQAGMNNIDKDKSKETPYQGVKEAEVFAKMDEVVGIVPHIDTEYQVQGLPANPLYKREGYGYYYIDKGKFQVFIQLYFGEEVFIFKEEENTAKAIYESEGSKKNTTIFRRSGYFEDITFVDKAKKRVDY